MSKLTAPSATLHELYPKRLCNPLDVSSVAEMVPLKTTIKKYYSEEALVIYLVNSIKEIPGYEVLQADVELVQRIYSIIEVIVTDTKVEIDKLNIILRVYAEVFTMTAGNTLILVNLVNFINDNKTSVYHGKSYWRRVVSAFRKLRS